MANMASWLRAFRSVEEPPSVAESLSASIHVPLADDTELLQPFATPDEEGDRLGYAEGQTFAIEYMDGGGEESVRRITVWGIKESLNGSVVLVAKCHERKATRSFRLDRIKAVIDLNGEVFEPPDAFFMEAFGMHPEVLAAQPDETDRADLNRAKNNLRDEIRLLAALAHADGRVDGCEVDEILIYCDVRLANADILLNDWQLKQLRSYIARMRPTRQVLIKSVDRLQSRFSEVGVGRFFAAAHAVVNADGVVHEDEAVQLADLYFEMTGLRL